MPENSKTERHSYRLKVLQLQIKEAFNGAESAALEGMEALTGAGRTASQSSCNMQAMMSKMM